MAIAPTTVAASIGATSIEFMSTPGSRSGRRARKFDLAAEGSQPIPISTAVRLGSILSAPIAASATFVINNCCGKARPRSFGGKRRRPSGSSIELAAAAFPASPWKNWRRTASIAPQAPACAPIPTTAIAPLGGRIAGEADARLRALPACSTIRWALLPPKPKALIAAQRGPFDAHSAGRSITRKRVPDNAGLSGKALGVAGSTPARIAINTLMSPAAPDAVVRCPIFAFSDPIASSLFPSKTCAAARISTASPRNVPVA